MFRKIVARSPVHQDLGLLLLRLGIGLSMLGFHGFGKISGGPELWRAVGAGMENLGIGFAPVLWGFLAAFAEFFASILLVLGVLFRPAAAMLAFTMFVAMLHHVNLPADSPGAGWSGASHALEMLIVYVTLFLTGPGRYAFSLIHRRDLRAPKPK
jgi:putative oxidoreductase